MRKQQHRVRCSMGMLLVLATFTVAEPVDPCRPAEREARQALAEEPAARWPATRIRQLESERDQELCLLHQYESGYLCAESGC